MDLSIIIINYNTEKYLKNCLTSIFQFTKKIQFEVIVVDNNSPEREIENFPLLYPEVKFYFRDANDGFGAGCNFGAKYAKGKYFLFLNPDITLVDNAIYGFYEFMETNKDIGLCSGLLTDLNGNPQYTYNFFHSMSWEFSEAITRTTDKKINKLNKIIINDKSKETFEVDWVTGACMFLRKEVFNAVNGFDESLFLYCEDVDLEFRMSKLGYRIVVLPQIKLLHSQGSSINSENRYDVYYYNLHKSKLKYMYKHFGFLRRNFIRLLFILGMFLRLVAVTFRKEKYPYTFKQIFNVLKLYLNNSVKKK